MSTAGPNPLLAAKTRQKLCGLVMHASQAAAHALKNQLAQSVGNSGGSRGAQTEVETLDRLRRHEQQWFVCIRDALQRQLTASGSRAPTVIGSIDELQLVSDEAVEDQLLVSRFATLLQEAGGQTYTDFRQRLIFVQNGRELSSSDLALPENIARTLFQAWVDAGMTRDDWKCSSSLLHKQFSDKIREAYAEANRFMVSNGVLREINLKNAVRKAPSSGHDADESLSASQTLPTVSANSPAFAQTQRLAGNLAQASGPGAEWWSRARNQTQEVFGRLKRIFAEQVGVPAGEEGVPVQASPRLQAMLQPGHASANGSGTGYPASSPVDFRPDMPVGEMAQLVRQRSAEFKQAAESPSEKAIIEIVALMFQSILTEDRLPPSLRVWFARLQIPVLRVALAEPDFFSSLQHPARRLIDRLGSCALGFDSTTSDVSSQSLETEVKRIVQVIEQYPETGRRVFQLASDEFQAFLARHLQSQGQAGKVVSVAQQVEQKETLTVQYTIELRKQLNDMPVRDEIRDFLFKIWAEALAVATIKFDAKHEMMTTLKKTASDLIWAASAKPTRSERAEVIAQLPNLLARLRKGMSMLGMDTPAQEQEIKRLSDILADAFMSKTESIPPEQLAAVTRNLSSLEDFLPQDGSVGDLDLDQDSIEMITGVDASNIHVITQGGQQPNEAMRAWALELQLGAWFGLDHNGSVAQVQLAWRSQRGQLCLFATSQQQFYLIQSAKVASYLQAGLLVPVEEESLTVRATRAALAKLDANPERLLH